MTTEFQKKVTDILMTATGNTFEVLRQASVDAREKFNNEGASKLLDELSKTFEVTGRGRSFSAVSARAAYRKAQEALPKTK